MVLFGCVNPIKKRPSGSGYRQLGRISAVPDLRQGRGADGHSAEVLDDNGRLALSKWCNQFLDHTFAVSAIRTVIEILDKSFKVHVFREGHKNLKKNDILLVLQICMSYFESFVVIVSQFESFCVNWYNFLALNSTWNDRIMF